MWYGTKKSLNNDVPLINKQSLPASDRIRANEWMVGFQPRTYVQGITSKALSKGVSKPIVQRFLAIHRRMVWESSAKVQTFQQYQRIS